MSFELLETFKEKQLITQLELCDLILENTVIPWVLLIPRREGILQINQLNKEDQIKLICEIDTISCIMEHLFPCDRLNVAAIGNKTPQLHVHIICRTTIDSFWPETIWGQELEKMQQIDTIRRAAIIKETLLKI